MAFGYKMTRFFKRRAAQSASSGAPHRGLHRVCLLNNSSEAGGGDWVHSGSACTHQYGFMKVKSCLTNLITICSEKTGSVAVGRVVECFFKLRKKEYLAITSSYRWLPDSKLKLYCIYFTQTNVNFILNTKYYLIPCHDATWIKYC